MYIYTYTTHNTHNIQHILHILIKYILLYQLIRLSPRGKETVTGEVRVQISYEKVEVEVRYILYIHIIIIYHHHITYIFIYFSQIFLFSLLSDFSI